MLPARLSRFLNHYFFATYFVVLAVLAMNLQYVTTSDLRSGLFVTAIFLTYAFIYLLPSLLLTKFAAAVYGRLPREMALLRRLVYVIAVLTTSLTLVILYADHTIYHIFGFHLNGFVWNLVSTPGGIESMGGSGSSTLGYALVVAGFFLFQALLLGVMLYLYGKQAKPARQIHGRRVYRYLLAIFIVATLGERVTYGVSNIQGYTPVLTASHTIPFYLPMTFKHLAARLGLDVQRDANMTVRLDGSVLDYPRTALETGSVDKPLNIIWLVAESLRADMLNEEVMPATSAFAQKAHRFNNHYSGANMTRMGMFSMFYGLYGAYWFPFLDAQRSPVVMDVIQQKNYQYDMYTSAKFSYPEFDKTIFSRIEREHLHEGAADSGWMSDRVNMGKMLDFIEHRDPQRPFMTFMFFESPHARYYFPDESIIRPDYLVDFNYLTSVNKADMPLVKNRYINAVHHLDSQIARVLKYVEEQQLLENTIILITGDHGEEFMEKGRWGHGSQFTEEQVRVPLVLWVPGSGASVDEGMTSHLDIPATILPLLGITNVAQDYSLGNNLLAGHRRDYTVVCDWNSVGYIGNNYKAVLPLKSAGFKNNEVRTRDDMPVIDAQQFFTDKQAQILAIMHELAAFTQHAQ
ncbi:MAG: sulfatase-like hydrolase/transferase [Granulosicoccaceae bacterium]|jgi:hypothetical protein